MSIISTYTTKVVRDTYDPELFVEFQDTPRSAQDVFNDLKAHLKADGRLLDNFTFDTSMWGDEEFPINAEIHTEVKYSESGDISLDVYLEYEAGIPEYNDVGEITGIEGVIAKDLFASCKSTSDSIVDLDKMHLAASSVKAAFYGSEKEVRARYTMVEKSKESVKLQPQEYAGCDSIAQPPPSSATKTDALATKPSIIEWLRKASKVTSATNEQNKPGKIKQHENNVL